MTRSDFDDQQVLAGLRTDDEHVGSEPSAGERRSALHEHAKSSPWLEHLH
jgi:hypothetical protein